MNTEAVQEGMEVFGSCGYRLGVVDQVEGGSIKLTLASAPDGRHHYLPLEWVDRVDQHVHLCMNCREAIEEWQLAPVGAGGG